MAKYCSRALHSTVEKVLNNQPYFKYEPGDKFIEVVPGGKINENNINGVVRSVTDTLNNAINKGDRNLGDVFYPTSKTEIIKGIRILPSEKQMALLDAEDEVEVIELQKEVDEENAKRELEIRNKEIEEEEDLFFQKEEVPASRASEETLNKVKDAIKKMGINIQDLVEYAKNTGLVTKSINGVADLVRGVIAVAQGMENQVLTEEMVHIGTAILEQTNPQLITQLISKIDRFKIYKKTLEEYKNNKNYQLSNGKPDIRKIKKEAVDKLIAEVIIYQSEGSTEFPELMQKENQSTIQKWWSTILDYLRGIYRKTDIDIFEDVAAKIIGEDIGTVKDITTTGTYFNIKNPVVDNFYNTVIDKDSRLKLNPETPTDKRHYTFDGKRVLKSVTEKIKEAVRLPERTPFQKITDEQKRDWGSRGHQYIEQYIATNLIDKDGYAREKFLDIPITSELNETIQKKLAEFAKGLISSYSKGTRFVVERKVVNENVKGYLASTVDFMAIEPIVKPDGTQDMKVDVLDWKFMSIDKTTEEDVQWFKQKEWISQMGEYSKIMYNYGIRREQLRKTRMIPFINNYSYVVAGDRKSGLRPTSIEIGKLDSLKETNLYLLPVVLPTESTGNNKVDTLLESLRQYHKKLYEKPVSPEDKFKKNLELNQLSKAIRSLHLKLDFEPLVGVGKSFLQNASATLKEFETLDYSKMSDKEIEKKLGDLIAFRESAEKFTAIDQIFLSQYPKEDLSKEDQIILNQLDRISKSTERMFEQIENLQTEYVIQLAVKRGISLELEDTPDGKRIKAEAEITGLVKTFEEGSKLPAKLINLATNLILKSNSIADITYAEKISGFKKLLLALEKEASTLGKRAFDMIGTVEPTGLKLIKKIDKAFWNQVIEAKEKGDKKFLMDNMDVEKFNELAKESMAKNLEDINNTVFSSDKEVNERKKQAAIARMRKSIDINREDFNGFESYAFGVIYNKAMKQEGHYSKEYIEMSKSKAALDMWNFFTELNEKAKSMGYFDKQGSSFFPLIEATTLEKFYKAQDKGAQVKDFFADLYTVRVNEENAYSKIDKETGKIKKQIPKYFTRMDKSKNVEQLSTDLNKVGSMWLKALIDYEKATTMQNTLLTILSVERAKGSLILDDQKRVVFEGGVPKVDENINKNADILETIIDDHLYNIQENLGSIGSVSLASVTEKLKKDEEAREKTETSVKKAIKNADILVRGLAVGLKPLIGFANWAGFQLHAFITSGNMYRFSEFEKNNARTTINLLSTLEKALLDMIVPLNEDVTTERRRQIAKEQGYMKYLSTWTFSDVMMVTNSFPERKLQFANALSFIENSMVMDGKIVNIRQYVKKQDRTKYKTMSYEERRAFEKTYENRVKELKDSKSLLKVAKIEDDKVIIPDVSLEELAEFRTKVVEFSRTLNGTLSEGNKAGYRRDTILTSFMMFKTWIPKLLSTRISDIKKNVELDEWTYGRARVFFKTWAHLGMTNITKMRDIINGTPEGLKILDEMLELKRQEYFKKTGQTLDITEEEFYDLIREQLSNEMKELGAMFSLMGLMLAAKAAEPPEDATDLEKNRYKYWAKAVNKVADELIFYYNPMSAETISRGTILPALGLLSKAEKVIVSLGKEVTGYALDDEEMIDKNYPLKYFLNIIPVGAQFQTEILPYIAPDIAKEMGIRVTTESRRQ